MDNRSSQKVPRVRLLRLIASFVLVAALAWLGGFVWFVRMTAYAPDAVPQHADGIVALTGGAGRIELALRLLTEGWADRLLITGIGGGTELNTLGRLAGIDTDPLAPRITLGRYAASTHGNGVETASWAEQNGVKTLLVVTASYHMPRALLELGQAVPNVRLMPVAVRPAHAPGGTQLADPGPGWRVEASEYVKYLLAVSGVTRLLPRREAVWRTHEGAIA